jgi:predicted MFS family arabinose efflux permease
MMPAQARRSLDVVLLFTGFIASTYGFGLYLFPAMVETVRIDMPFSYAAMGSITGGVQAGFMLCALLAGVMTLRFGATALILGSVAVCALALAGLAIAPNIAIAAILLTVLGGCAAAVWVPMVDVVHALIPHRHQAKALGLVSSGTSYGVFLNSFLLTDLLEPLGWRPLWGITGGLVATLLLIGILRLRGRMPRSDHGAPAIGAAPSALSRLRALPPGLSALILGMMLLNGLACIPFQTYLSPFIEREAHGSAVVAAQAWRIIGLTGMVSGFAMGALADRITVRRGLLLAYLVLAGACALLVAATNGGQDALLTGAALAFGLSFYPIFGLVPAYISQTSKEGDAALLFALGNIALGMGGIIGNMLGGYLKDLTESFVPVYLIMLGAALLSAVICLLLPKQRSSLVSQATEVAR